MPKNADPIKQTVTNIMVVDIETTGFPEKLGFYKYYDYTDTDKYNNSRIVQIAWGLYDKSGKSLKSTNHIIKPNGFMITNHEYHGITDEFATDLGIELTIALQQLLNDLKTTSLIVGHNMMFSENIIMSEAHRYGMHQVIDEFKKKRKCCTGFGSEQLVKIELEHGKYKMPSLEELYNWCFKKPLTNQHNAKYDVIHIAECYFYIKSIKKN
ncbi:DEDdh 3'-5' exonuclease [Fadolivirus algeromassiliense]|jgi:DNA polymerase-3 subunit alpha|uniref:DEDdh 3'-5' exonuclease n=1 Tax=Fadolivirus FV1/VV64 TaxID=3070911 RepID=A0A7D3UQY0_9VIRU|nr:DEDdh 3'-5' exonuclease [Fadolivirus algeromassiliense]QKF94808.1 DEDdh 3'-5' exonuclease [Fadolivirus FV1/VV64]